MFFDSLSSFNTPSALLPIMAVWCALVLEKLIRVSPSVDPLAFFSFVCKRMASKVIEKGYAQQQLLISGSLALIMLVLPLMVIVYLLHSFASYQWLFDTLLLWLLIQYSQDAKMLNKGVAALKDDKKQLSKDLLQLKLLRNTQALSALGLTKASVESLFLRYHHQQFTTVLCYLALGPIAALCYRLCYEAHQAYNAKLPEYAAFGRLANRITRIFQFIPCIIMSISFVIISSPHETLNFLKQRQLWQILKQTFTTANLQTPLLFSLAHALNINVGGPVMYGGEKQQRPRLSRNIAHHSIKSPTKLNPKEQNKESQHKNSDSTSAEPTLNTVNILISLLNRHLLVTLLLITWISFWLVSR